MTTLRKKPSRLANTLRETAAGMHKSGLLDRAAYDKIARRHLGPDNPKGAPKVPPKPGA